MALEKQLDGLQTVFCALLSEEMCLAFVVWFSVSLAGGSHPGQE